MLLVLPPVSYMVFRRPSEDSFSTCLLAHDADYDIQTGLYYGNSLDYRISCDVQDSLLTDPVAVPLFLLFIF